MFGNFTFAEGLFGQPDTTLLVPKPIPPPPGGDTRPPWEISPEPQGPDALRVPDDIAAGLYCHAKVRCYIIYVPILSVSKDRESIIVLLQGLRITIPTATVIDLALGPPPFEAAPANSFTLPLH